MAHHFDILIIGGGMAGASLACALKALPYRIAVVEAVPPGAEGQPSFDTRAIALSQGSKRIFDALGVWSAMAELGVTPIEHIHVSDRGHFGAARIHARDEGVDALGYVVEAGVLGGALGPAMAQQDNVELIAPARLVAMRCDHAGAHAVLDTAAGQRRISAALVVAADGGRSTVRELMGSRSARVGYGQTAVIANVVTDKPHGNIAYERFTDTGPLAMLPCRAVQGAEAAHGDRRWSLVWTVHDEQVAQLLALDDASFLARLQQRFGHRAGRLLAASPRCAYPLGLQYVPDHVGQRLVYIGNAAHAIHPVAGQGFNLGLRDVAALAEVLADACADVADPGSDAVLSAYKDWRRADYLRVMGLTDTLARVFSNRFPPLVVARNLGMLALDLLAPIKRLFTRQTMGLNGRLPRLARGLPLRAPTSTTRETVQ